MWNIDYVYETKTYYIVNKENGKRIKVKPLTVGEIKNNTYGGNYYTKAYVECEKANGETVYLDRQVNGKTVTYRYTPKKIRE